MPQGAAPTAQTVHPFAPGVGPVPVLGAGTQPGTSVGSLPPRQPRAGGSTGHPGTREEGARAEFAIARAGYPLQYKCREIL